MSSNNWAGRQPAIWIGLFTIGLVVIRWSERSGLIAFPLNLILIGVCSLTLWPFMLSAVNRARASGTASAAMIRYQKRSLIWAISYIVALGFAMTVKNRLHPDGAALWSIAILPSLPIFYFIWALGRYLVEEGDEYQRMRQIKSALVATGLLLGVATFWGFLGTFGLVDQAPGWAAVPIWAVGLGLGQLVQTLSDKRGGEE